MSRHATPLNLSVRRAEISQDEAVRRMARASLILIKIAERRDREQQTNGPDKMKGDSKK